MTDLIINDNNTIINQAANGDSLVSSTIKTDLQDEIMVKNPVNVVSDKDVKISIPANDNDTDTPPTTDPSSRSFLIEEIGKNFTLPNEVIDWITEYHANDNTEQNLDDSLLQNFPFQKNYFLNHWKKTQEGAAKLLICEAYLASFLRNIKTRQGTNEATRAALGIKTKEEIIAEYGLTAKQARDIQKLTLPAVLNAIKYAFEHNEIPTRKMAFSRAVSKTIRTPKKKISLKLQPVIEDEYKTLNLCKPMNATSLFCNIGIGTYYVKDLNINLKVCSEYEAERMDWHRALYPDCEGIVGDFADAKVYKKVRRKHRNNHCDLVFISCPCQDASNMNTAESKGKRPQAMLFKKAVDFVKETKVKFALFENVPSWLNSRPEIAEDILNGRTIFEYIKEELENDGMVVNAGIFSAADYGTSQDRERSFILCSRCGIWKFPKKLDRQIPLFQVIGDFKSLDKGEKDPNNKWHYDSDDLNDAERLFLSHTPTACGAWYNTPKYQPINKDGSIPSGIIDANYSREDWGRPAHTITTGSGSISSPYTIHPGYQKSDGTWSDPRCFSIAELLRIIGLLDDFYIPYEPGEKDGFIRTVFGEHLCPKHMLHLLSTLPVPADYLAKDEVE